MIRPHHAIAIWSVGWLTGILLGSVFSLNLWTLAISLGLVLAILFMKGSVLPKACAILAFGLLLGWWRQCLAIDTFPAPPSPLPASAVTLAGRVVSDPVVDNGQQQLHLRVTALNGKPVNFRAQAYVWQLPAFTYNTDISGQFRLQLPQNQGTFDYIGYLAKDHISVIAYPAGDITITATHRSLAGTLYTLRHLIDARLKKLVPGLTGLLLSGLVLGGSSSLPDDFKLALQHSGTSHIVALSGFNITIIIAAMVGLLGFLPRRVRYLVSGIAIILFVIMSGAASSVLRAAVMGCVFLLAGIWGRRQYLINGILLAVVLMTAMNPAVLQHDVGLQLSLFATLGIVWLTPLLTKLLVRWPTWLSETVTTTVAAMAFTLPILIYNFSGVSLVALLANVLVLPIVPVAMAIGFAALCLSLVIPIIPILTLVVWLPLAWIIGVIQTLGNLPVAFLTTPAISPFWIVGYYLFLGAITYFGYYGFPLLKTSLALARG